MHDDRDRRSDWAVGDLQLHRSSVVAVILAFDRTLLKRWRFWAATPVILSILVIAYPIAFIELFSVWLADKFESWCWAYQRSNARLSRVFVTPVHRLFDWIRNDPTRTQADAR